MEPTTVRAVTTAEELRAILGEPQPRARDKDRPVLDAYDREWLGHSPMCFVATSSADGSCDVSPKGDPPGFVHVLDDRTVAVPERPGNRRADGFHNVLANPHVGLISVIPGRGDTLRVNGRATLISDAPFFDAMVEQGHRPLLALVVHVEQVFYHCSKAFLRSELWEPETWAPGAMPSRAEIAHRLERPEDDLAELRTYYGPSYADGLYRA